MTVTKARALRLASAGERSLIESSFGRPLGELSDARLRQKIGRARTLRDKYRDLAKRQRLEMRGKRDPSGRRAAQGNENTKLKAEMFAEALERLQGELAGRREAGEGGSSRSRTGGRAAKRGGKARAKRGASSRTSKTSDGAASPRKGKRLAREASGPRKAGEAAMKGARQRRWDEG